MRVAAGAIWLHVPVAVSHVFYPFIIIFLKLMITWL